MQAHWRKIVAGLMVLATVSAVIYFMATGPAEMLETSKPDPDENTEAQQEADNPMVQDGVQDIEFETITPIENAQILSDYQAEMESVLIEKSYSQEEAADYLSTFMEWYRVGTISSQESSYDGWTLALLNQKCDGPCFSSYLYRFAWNESTGELVNFEAHSNDYHADFLEPLFEQTTKELLQSLVMPEKIALENNAGYLEKGLEDASYGGIEIPSHYEVAYEDPALGPIYKTNEDVVCFYAQSKDGSFVRYELDPGFFDEDQSVSIEWDNGERLGRMDERYSFEAGGCGISGACYTAKELDEEELERVGETSNGHTLYMAIDPYEGAHEDDEATEPQKRMGQAYENYQSQLKYNDTLKEYANFEAFVEDHSVVYWKNELGTWGTLVSVEAKTPAECAKPVIYLYPEKTRRVHVQVDVEDFTVTIPKHGRFGWFVKSTPESEIYNYLDGETYPYLFWESNDYQASFVPEHGFMVSRDEVPQFLNEKLDELGFTDQESADFREFWQPRMLANTQDHFFVSFVGTQDFNQVAPLNVTPEPDTLIRVFMYYQPVDNPYPVVEQKLGAPVRKGFTVFEWGGTSSAPWEPAE